ncbi:6-phospho-3-hexuloisomerase [Pedobacter sp. GR22-10]|uniref:6-phospho-3-hexuloisomerase n=1 Tax=Pedobacter sp. GR22-10 TaxID=2994472 RepID=UPI002246ED55|nr:6-phospho-3-hexuloisomerase [Pedobacter sp. GR22-10]MCX2430499.1 6-phospho-3-hexuloisomerase [Pedobacter sp. GR22-10]
MQNETEELADNQQLVWDLQMNLELVLNENLKLAKDIDLESLVPLIGYIQQSPRIFIVSAGRSGFAMRAAAMRLMHLGLQVYIVGDTTTPAINQEDLLIAASGSGTTSGIVRAAEKAVSIGAKLVTLTADPNAALAKLADHVVYIPAAGKEEHGSGKSAQYAGSLFEQFLMLLMDAVFQSLWKLDGTPAAALYQRHANLE